MFERKIEETIAFLLKETIADQDSITSRQIFASEIPEALKRMFEQDVDIWVVEERARMTQSPHFRYEDSDIVGLFEQIILRVREHAVFSRNEYVERLEKNVKLLFNYLCRPQWTLQKYLFADREHAATDDIVDGLRYFWNYEYYRIILQEYFNKKDLTVMQARKFGELLNHIDSEVVRNFDSRKLAHLAEPIFTLFSIGSGSEEKFVPVEALSIFFDDKNLLSIVERLDREKELREQITLHDLVMVISEVDFTMSFDISAIVNEHVHQAGVMKPERNVTAGEDFEVPEITAPEHEEEDRREIGHEDGDLDFVITDEEDAVVEQHYDSIPSMEDDLLLEEDAVDEDALATTIEAEEQYAAEDTADTETDDALRISDEEYIEDDDSMQDDFPSDAGAYGETLLEDNEELPDMDDYDSTVETILDIEQQLEEQDTIPDLSLEGEQEDENEDYALVEEEMHDSSGAQYGGNAGHAGAGSSVLDDLPDISLEEEEDSSPEPGEDNAELDIDWEKEAEDIPDMDLEETADEGKALPDDSIPGISLENEDQLKPAEELLGELDLDLDDLDEKESPSPRRHNDIPIVEEEVPEARSSARTEEPTDDDTPSRPVQEVVAEFGDLKQLIPAGDRKKYVKKLFRKDDEAFDRAMNVLNGKATWREASEYIDELFIKHDVDMYSRLAVKFTDDVYKRYLNEK
ncbi:MAG: hypothetical protein RRA94_00110 [Bacteroidota bacterium]|nr:hypothetical protein [Bacteroidota bacterium]